MSKGETGKKEKGEKSRERNGISECFDTDCDSKNKPRFTPLSSSLQRIYLAERKDGKITQKRYGYHISFRSKHRILSSAR